ncbi:M48 family metalloprotease [Actinokineospora cianjurensis]|uniref:Zn-dependent protease with chaperone function n=1 Tax=Actinokineospora cianjurensis TaxID=585224 RepID=A0A421B0X8_9PSEU|nr:M48 family metalloprotease [Actinokineospora cianjurensis]RLK58034.1 Zn-dependent protease with chaperone function [Actinokineospora cianjurensis]
MTLAEERTRRTGPIPTGMVTLFLLLTATVCATVGLLGMLAWLTVGDHVGDMVAAYERCAPPTTATDESLFEANDAAHRSVNCLASITGQQAAWALYAVLLLAAVALCFYLAYPRLLIRRHRLVLLREQGDLAAYLAELRDLVGLRRAPVYLLGSRSGTMDALTFGAFRRRYVVLDAGLLRAYTLDRARFRAVVLHELAHARGQDVHLTYLTKSLWWAFVLVAWVPVLVQVAVLRSWWALITVAGLAVVTALVLLTRNAILREREVHADGVAARHDGPDGMLGDLVSAEPRPASRWRLLLAHHPDPAWRRRVIDDPALLLRPRWWEMPAAGLAVGVIAPNLWFVIVSSLVSVPGLNSLVVGWLIGPALAVPVAVASWRTAVLTPGRRAVRVPLTHAVCLAAGFIVGQQVALRVLIQISTRTDLEWPHPASVLLLVAGLAVVALWASTVSTAFDHPPRWVLPVVVAGVAGALWPWLASWWVWTDVDRVGWWVFLDQASSYDLTIPDVPGWVSALAHWTQVRYVPLHMATWIPFIVPLLALLWLVPILITRSVFDTRRALRAGVIGAAAFTVAAVVVVVAARLWLSGQARGSDGFRVGLHFTLVAVAVVAQVGVAVGLRGPHRAVLTPLAVVTTGLLSTVVLLFGVDTLGRAVDVWRRPTRSLFAWPDLDLVVETLNQVVLTGAVLSAFGVLVAAGRKSAQVAPRGGVVFPALVAVGAVAVGVLTVPSAYRTWVTSTATGVQPVTGAECLLGTWVEVDRTSVMTLSTEVGPMRFQSSGSVQAFDSDGTVVLSLTPIRSDHNGHIALMTYSGAVTADYHVDGAQIRYDNIRPGTTWSVSVDDHPAVLTGPVTTFTPDAFTCTNNTMTQTGTGYTITLTRTAHPN